jgi:hypothetical protein
MFSIFSKRNNLKPIKNLQEGSIDDELKNQLWNIINLLFLNNFINFEYSDDQFFKYNSKDYWTAFKIIHHFLKQPTDTLPKYKRDFYKDIRDLYFQKFQWFEVFDFIEFLINLRKSDDIESNNKIDYDEWFNPELESNNSIYRLVNGLFVKNISESEIESLKEVLNLPNYLKNVSKHIELSIKKLYDRQNPDYRNSIKESISAVEALCVIISPRTSPKDDTLGKSLDKIQNQRTIQLHGKFVDGLKKLYGYTNDHDGIRHYLKDDPNSDFEDAKFMLVSCSALCNFLVAKANKANIKLS